MASDLLKQTFIGTVLKVDRENRRVGVFIPKLMATMYDSEAQDYNYATNNGIALNNLSTAISNTVEKKNYLWIKPRERSNGLPDVGSKVLVKFLDGNPRLGYYCVWNINGDYKIIEEEKYPELFNLEIDADRAIKKGYDVKINFPQYFNTTAYTDDENHEITYNVNENFSFYKGTKLQTVINNLQKSVEFVEKKYIAEFLVTIMSRNIFETKPTAEPYWTSHISTYTTQLNENNEEETVLNQTEVKHKFFTINTTNKTRDEIISAVNNIDLFAYPLHNYNIVEQIVAEYKDILNKTTNAKDAAKAATELESKLAEYGTTVQQDVHKEFLAIRKEAAESILAQSNLLDSDIQYNYYNKLLAGLAETYTLYTDYRARYEKLTDADKELISDRINIYLIDDNIRLMFMRALNSSDKTNVDDYIHYIKSIYRTKPIIKYHYSRDGSVEESSTVLSEHLFKHLTSSDYVATIGKYEYDVRKLRRQDMLSDEFKNEKREVKLYPIVGNLDIAKCAFQVVNWYDDAGRSILDPSYTLIRSIDVKPKFIGMYISTDETNVDFTVVNDDDIEYNLYIGNVQHTYEEVKQYVKDNSLSSNFKIYLEYPSMEKDKLTNATKWKKLEISINYSSSEYVEALTELIYDLNKMDLTNFSSYIPRIEYVNRIYKLMNHNKLSQDVHNIMTDINSKYDSYKINEVSKNFELVKLGVYTNENFKNDYNGLTTSQQESFKSGLESDDLATLNTIITN